jgi:hypothetical protein|nr:MAG TPA: activating signal cointegrator [Caudoviricetes sp.]
MPKIHDLKILPAYFNSVAKGLKTFEVRFDDRDYMVGDLLLLREWSNEIYTGRRVMVEITCILKGFEGLKDGWAVLGIKRIKGGLK